MLRLADVVTYYGPIQILKSLDLEVRAGEIMGIAGVAGNGQNELMLALSGERTSAPETAVRIDSRPVAGLGAAQRRALGVCCVPEERNGHAAVPEIARAITAHSSTLKRSSHQSQNVWRGMTSPRRQSGQRAVESRLRWETVRNPRHEEQRTSAGCSGSARVLASATATG